MKLYLSTSIFNINIKAPLYIFPQEKRNTIAFQLELKLIYSEYASMARKGKQLLTLCNHLSNLQSFQHI